MSVDFYCVQGPFSNIYSAMLNTMVMTLGEIEYVDNYLPMDKLDPFAADANILLSIFLFLMPIVLMNLMVRQPCCNQTAILNLRVQQHPF